MPLFVGQAALPPLLGSQCSTHESLAHESVAVRHARSPSQSRLALFVPFSARVPLALQLSLPSHVTSHVSALHASEVQALAAPEQRIRQLADVVHVTDLHAPPVGHATSHGNVGAQTEPAALQSTFEQSTVQTPAAHVPRQPVQGSTAPSGVGPASKNGEGTTPASNRGASLVPPSSRTSPAPTHVPSSHVVPLGHSRLRHARVSRTVTRWLT